MTSATENPLKSYIVVLKDSCDPTEFRKSIESITDAKVEKEFEIFKGYQIQLPESHFSTLENDANVVSIEEDREVKTC